jgi:hypothetical protein
MWRRVRTNDNKKSKLVLSPSCHRITKPFITDPVSTAPDSFRLIALEELPLSTKLGGQFRVWLNKLEATCDERAISRFLSLEVYESFDQEGFELWQKVCMELASSYNIFYYSERLGGLFKHPDMPMVKRIKLMSDYGCYPIWGIDEINNIAPEKLPLEAETISRLNAWANLFDDGLNWDDPAGESLWSREDAQFFQQEKISLWHQLHHELSPEYEVYLYLFSCGGLIKHPDESNG